MKFRIFTDDRGVTAVHKKPMYSALCDVEAKDAAAAIALVDPNFGPPDHAPIAAIEWPPTDQYSKDWLRKHV